MKTSIERQNIFHSLDLKKEETQIIQHQKTCVVIIPLTIPGTGKTLFIKTLSEMLKKMGKFFDTIGSDVLRKEMMDRTRKDTGITDKTKLFEMTGKSSTAEFFKKMGNKLKFLQNADSLFYIDKNHPPNALARTLSSIKQSISGANIKIVALVPDCKYFFKLNEYHTYPFSLSYFIQCYMRVKLRRNHETLNGDQDIMNIMGMFFNSFINIQFDSNTLLGNYQFSNVIKLPFTDEIPESELTPQIIEASKKFFASFKTGSFPIMDNLAYNLDKLIVDFCKIKQFASTIDLVNSTAVPIIDRLFKLETQKESENSIKASDLNIKTEIQKLSSTEEKEENKKSIPEDVKGKDELGIKIDSNQTIIKANQRKNEFLDSRKVVFLGLQLDQTNIENRIIKICEDGSQIIWNYFKDKCVDDFYFDLYKKISKWYYPKSFHVTTLFIGNNPEMRNDEIYIRYKDNEIVNVDIVGFVFVPDKLLACLTLQNYNVKNRIPHMTTLLNQWKPQNSNDVLEAIFINGDLKNEYNSVFKNTNYTGTFVKRLDIKVLGENVRAYVLKFNTSYKFISKAKYFQN